MAVRIPSALFTDMPTVHAIHHPASPAILTFVSGVIWRIKASPYGIFSRLIGVVFVPVDHGFLNASFRLMASEMRFPLARTHLMLRPKSEPVISQKRGRGNGLRDMIICRHFLLLGYMLVLLHLPRARSAAISRITTFGAILILMMSIAHTTKITVQTTANT